MTVGLQLYFNAYTDPIGATMRSVVDGWHFDADGRSHCLQYDRINKRNNLFIYASGNIQICLHQGTFPAVYHSRITKVADKFFYYSAFADNIITW